MTKPRCMSDEDYLDWTAKNLAIYSLTDRAPSPCYDCTCEYAAEMTAAGMCDGAPGGIPIQPMTVEESHRRALEARLRTKQANIARAAELWERGLLRKQIAAEMGASVSGVDKWLREWRTA